MTYILTVEQGKLSAGSEANKARLNEDLRLNEGKEYRLEKVKALRSSQQNRLYWVYLGIIERETGNMSDYLHSYFKEKYLPPKFIKIKGKEHKVVGSTTTLSKNDFIEFMDKICSEVNIPIPNPEEAGYISN